MRWFFVLLVLTASPTSAQTFVDKLADFQVIDCKSEDGSQEMAFAILRSEKGVQLKPGGAEVTEENDVLTARYNGGVITISGDRYTFLSPDALETGLCSDLTEILAATINRVADEEPDLFRMFVKASVQTSAEQFGFLSDMVKKAQSDLFQSEAQLNATLEKQTDLLRQLGEANAAKARMQLDKKAAVDEAARLSADLKKQVDEQDRLKRMVCKLNPKATFAVCKD